MAEIRGNDGGVLNVMITPNRVFARVQVVFNGKAANTLFEAAQLRQLARECERLAEELEGSPYENPAWEA